MLPILYLSFFNRATGDDYGYGAVTKWTWRESHSLIQVFKAAAKEVADVYRSWQGTWTSVFLFSLQPEVFHDKAYVITAFLMSGLLIGSIAYLVYEIFCCRLKFSGWSFWLIFICLCLNCILFVPSAKSAIYWYNGTVHYTLPFALCLILTVLLLRYVEEFKKGQYIGIFLIMVLMGGSNYQAALFALIVTFYTGAWAFFCHKEKKAFWLLPAIAVEMTGLIISMKAPGNKVRGGEEFGFSLWKGMIAIGDSFVGGITDIGDYLLQKPLIFVIFLLMFLFMTEAWSATGRKVEGKRSCIFPVALFCLYCAMQTPQAYADVEVSGGVYNMNYWVFLLFFTGVLAVLSGEAARLLMIRNHRNVREWIRTKFILPGIAVCMLLCFLLRSQIKESLWYTCVDYIRSGQAQDYREQMDLQTDLLTDDSVRDVVVPFINDIQGPLMHMPVTDDPQEWSNTVTARFYGKDSVVAMDRVEWEKKYGTK